MKNICDFKKLREVDESIYWKLTSFGVSPFVDESVNDMGDVKDIAAIELLAISVDSVIRDPTYRSTTESVFDFAQQIF